MKKRITLIVLAAITLVVLAACGQPAANGASGGYGGYGAAQPAASEAAQEATTSDTVAEGDQVFTLEELAKYNGKDGNPAYVAVDGVVYDVTNVPEWADGEHNGFSAGNDLTEEIKTVSPHGVSKLQGVPVVGMLEG